jgi:multimeric flavodoxin WrbA
MKVVAFNGSPRKKGNTYHCVQTVLEDAGHAISVLKRKTCAAYRMMHSIYSWRK